MSISRQICPECGSPMNGRIDKKYCSDICRTSFHNRNRIMGNEYIRNVNNILMRNRRILMDHTNDARAFRVRLLELQSEGFDFNYYTHCRPDRNGNIMVFCYEYGYLRTGEAEVSVVNSDPMNSLDLFPGRD